MINSIIILLKLNKLNSMLSSIDAKVKRTKVSAGANNNYQ